MNPHQREHLRLSILRYCDSAHPYTLAAPLLLQFLHNEGARFVTPEHVRAEASYLVEKHLIAPVEKPISPENPAWRITAAGRDLLATQTT